MTVLVGSGATIEIGGPKTDEITDAVCLRNSFLAELRQAVQPFVSPAACTFEDLFHVLETLDSYSTGERAGVVPEFKPRPAAVMTAKDPRWLNNESILRASRELIDEVGDIIQKRHATFDPTGTDAWYSAFWNRIVSERACDICTLNYDQTIEQCIGAANYEDGFAWVGSAFARFDPRQLRKSAKSRILHLHGSTRYGYPIEVINQFAFEDDFNDLYLMPSDSAARSTWQGRSTDTSQAHETVIAGPIITGLRKTEKVTIYPYSTYRDILAESVEKSPFLLVAGYSFGDGYINSILRRMRRLHGESCRVVLVTYVSEATRNMWTPDHHALMEEFGWPTPGMNEFLQRVATQDYYLDSHEYRNPWTSKNGCVRLYLNGMRAAITDHSDDIVEFLRPKA